MTKHNEWYTPKGYIEPIREFYGGTIDYDPASCIKANETIKAENFSSIDDEGNPLWWKGNIWCNPPYNHSADRSWLLLANRYYRDNDNINQIIMLLNRSTGAWYHKFLDSHPHGYFQLRDRVRFIDGETGEKSSPRYNNDLIYWGRDSQLFYEMCIENFGKPTPHSFHNL
jgi:DNA N-6-adenine-methyltransferase (Dam)